MSDYNVIITKFGKFIRNIRKEKNDSLRQMAIKLGISASFLSDMEIGRKYIPVKYVDKIKSIYNLTKEQEIELENCINETNGIIEIKFEYLNDHQKDIALLFARKIKIADDELLRKLKVFLC